MRKIAHISDLHFGRVDCAILPALTAAIAAAQPDLVAVSGDLTQRARSSQFAAARKFLDQLPQPQIVVPGNHDVPLYNLLKRWLSPLGNYRRHVSEDVEPFYADGEIAVLGINSARSLTFKDGRINSAQVGNACRRFGQHPQAKARIVVTHHPFDVPDTGREGDIIGRAQMAMAEFARCGVDIILTGHLHMSSITSSAARYQASGQPVLFIQAGTATSIRQRGEPNSWNLLTIDGETVRVDCFGWNSGAGAFDLLTTSAFSRGAGGWAGVP